MTDQFQNKNVIGTKIDEVHYLSEGRLLAALPTELFIGGEWRTATDGVTFEVIDPATESILKSVSDASVADGEAALMAAHAAQPSWGRTPPRARAEILRRAFALLISQTEEFALTITMEMGKPLAEARAEVGYGAEFLRWFSEETSRISGTYGVAPTGDSRLLVMKRPVGPCLLITPWNFPLAMVTRKIAPAIAAGCTMVLKPAELTPLTALLFAKLLQEAGLPDGVLNVIPTSNAAKVTGPLIKNGRLRKLSFTGSTEVGRILIASSAEQVLRVSMELGGNAPFMVFEDADIDSAVAGAVLAKMRNGGESCISANRFLVHESVAQEFIDKFVTRMSEFVLGRGTESAVTLGPLIDKVSLAKVESLVDSAKAAGATVILGGKPMGGLGYFYQPTVITGVPEGSRILNAEIFGPVAQISTFSTETEAVRQANATPFGLVCYAYTRDLNRTLRLAEDLETGMLGINTGIVSNPAAPFGGVKQSGLGREGGNLGIEEFLETCYVGISDPISKEK